MLYKLWFNKYSLVLSQKMGVGIAKIISKSGYMTKEKGQEIQEYTEHHIYWGLFHGSLVRGSCKVSGPCTLGQREGFGEQDGTIPSSWKVPSSSHGNTNTSGTFLISHVTPLIVIIYGMWKTAQEKGGHGYWGTIMPVTCQIAVVRSSWVPTLTH